MSKHSATTMGAVHFVEGPKGQLQYLLQGGSQVRRQPTAAEQLVVGSWQSALRQLAAGSRQQAVYSWQLAAGG